MSDLADKDKLHDWIENKHLLAFALRPPEASAPTVDILVQPKIGFEEAFTRRVDKELGGFKLSLASLDDLIALKTDTGRPHDISDIAALRRLRSSCS